MSKGNQGSSVVAAWTAGVLIWAAALAGLASLPHENGFRELVQRTTVPPELSPLPEDAAVIEAGLLEPTGRELPRGALMIFSAGLVRPMM